VLPIANSVNTVYYWQSYEMLNCQMEAVMRNLWSLKNLNNNVTPIVTIRDLYRGALFSQSPSDWTKVNIQLPVKPVQVQQMGNTTKRFPDDTIIWNSQSRNTIDWLSGAVVVRNLDGAPFDNFSCIKMVNTSSSHFQDILCVGQSKKGWQELSIFDIWHEYEKSKTAIQQQQALQMEMMFVVFTTRPVLLVEEKEDDSKKEDSKKDKKRKKFIRTVLEPDQIAKLLPERTVLIYRDNYMNYYGHALANRAYLTSFDVREVNINIVTSEALKVLPGIGDVIAQQIIKSRAISGPFKDWDHLKTQVPKFPDDLQNIIDF